MEMDGNPKIRCIYPALLMFVLPERLEELAHLALQRRKALELPNKVLSEGQHLESTQVGRHKLLQVTARMLPRPQTCYELHL